MKALFGESELESKISIVRIILVESCALFGESELESKISIVRIILVESFIVALSNYHTSIRMKMNITV